MNYVADPPVAEVGTGRFHGHEAINPGALVKLVSGAMVWPACGSCTCRMRSFLMVAEAGNLANAAKGDVTKQSQFSRQIKELEAYFGVALTRRVPSPPT